MTLASRISNLFFPAPGTGSTGSTGTSPSEHSSLGAPASGGGGGGGGSIGGTHLGVGGVGATAAAAAAIHGIGGAIVAAKGHEFTGMGHRGTGGGGAGGRHAAAQEQKGSAHKGKQREESEPEDFHSLRPPYLHSMIAGGLGGSTGDMMMHSLDTVKTRQQGAPNVLKYSTMGDAYATIFREEGFRRGLYGGVTPAFMGSLPGTMIFFGSYEYSKRHLLDAGCPEWLAYLSGGLIGDLFASVVYVPSEVLKTRLQLQGRYNNPYFKSGYNYRGTIDATRTIIRSEGFSALFYGYKATLMRDLPFSALQFAFYEEFQKLAKWYKNSRDIGIPLEIITGGAAGGLAGVITCPLDVVKTRVQTQVRTGPTPISKAAAAAMQAPHVGVVPTVGPSPTHTTAQKHAPPQQMQQKHQTQTATGASGPMATAPTTPSATPSNARAISTSSPSTTPPPKPGTSMVKLNTSSILRGLQIIYRSEGIQGLFRGVGPRMVWTSVQSGTMLVLYQTLLKGLSRVWPMEEGELDLVD